MGVKEKVRKMDKTTEMANSIKRDQKKTEKKREREDMERKWKRRGRGIK